MALILRGCTYYVEYPDPDRPGATKRKSAGTSDRAQAEDYQREWLKVVKAQKAGGIGSGGSGGKTWDDATERWLEDKEGKADIKGDRQKLEWLKPHLGGKRLADIDEELIRKVLRQKKAETTPQTANHYLALIKAILRRAHMKWKVGGQPWIKSVPQMEKFPIPPEVSDENKRFLSMEQIDKLVAELPTHLRRMYLFSLATGLRQGAVRKLEWSQVMMDTRFAFVTRRSSKSRKPLGVPLNDTAMKVLEECKAEREQLLQLGQLEPQDAAFVFLYRARRIRNVNTRAWRKAVYRAGVQDFTWHQAGRHTWASHMARKGTPLPILQEAGGWASPDMVNEYAHLNSETLRQYQNNAPV